MRVQRVKKGMGKWRHVESHGAQLLLCVFLRVAGTHLSLFNRSSVEYSLPRFLSSLISP